MDAENLSRTFRERRKLYEDFTKSLSQLLKDLIGSAGIEVMPIEKRTKTVKSFDEKIAREDKEGRYSCLEDITDLCGVRVITYLKEESEAIASLISKNFAVDAANSIDKEEDLPADRFGYRSVHFVVSLSKERAKLPEFERFAGLKAEIQIRTVLQHAWAAIDWKFRYKSEEEAPKELRRRLFRISALLEAADDDFSYVSGKLSELRKDYQEKLSRSDLGIPLNSDSLQEYLAQSDTVVRIVSAANKVGLIERPQSTLGISRLWRIAQYIGLEEISALDDCLKKSESQYERIFRVYEEERQKILKEASYPGIREMARSAMVRTILTVTIENPKEVQAATRCAVDGKVAMELYKNIHARLR